MMRIFPKVITAAVFAFATYALAGPMEDRLASEVATKAAEAYARDRIANYLNKHIESSLSTGSGTFVFATLDLGSAAYDFAHADNDKQRTYAGSRAAIAGYALLGGPAAPVLGAVLLAASLIEGGLAASHQAAMLRIYKQIQEDYTRVTEIQRLQLEVESIQFRALIATAVGALAEYSTNIQYFGQSCSDAGSVTDLDALDACVAALARGMLAAKLFVTTIDILERWETQQPVLFAKLSNAADFSLQDIIDARNSAKKLIQEHGPRTESIISSFSKIATELIVTGALQRPMYPTAEWIQMECVDTAMSHTRYGTELLLRRTALGERISILYAQSFIRGVDTYFQSICYKLVDSMDTQPYRSVLLRWNEMVTSTRVTVANTFGLR